MADSFAPTALFLDCNHLYHKLRASDEALACGYCVSRLRRWVMLVGNLRFGASWRGVGYNPAFVPACGGGGVAVRGLWYVVDIDPFVIDGFVNGGLFRTYGALS